MLASWQIARRSRRMLPARLPITAPTAPQQNCRGEPGGGTRADSRFWICDFGLRAIPIQNSKSKIQNEFFSEGVPHSKPPFGSAEKPSTSGHYALREKASRAVVAARPA